MTRPYAPISRAIGASLEACLDLVHDVYRREGQAVVWHEGVQAIRTRNGWTPVDSRPDYSGLVCGSGRMIAFDAKHCADRRYRHPKTRSHQLRALYEVSEAGGIAGLLVVNLNESLAWWLPARPEWAYGEFTSTLLGELPYALPVGCHTSFYEFVPDWLTVAREL